MKEFYEGKIKIKCKLPYKIRPGRLLLGWFVCCGVYALLIRVQYGSRTSHRVMDPVGLIHSDLHLFLPASKHAILVTPDVSRVTKASTVVFIQSDHGNIHKRELIRNTWGNPNYYEKSSESRIFVIFAIGLRINTGDELELEMSDHNDILLLNMVDVYYSLAIKGLLTMEWIYHNIPHANYVIKTDDDVFLNTYAWINAVHSLKTNNVNCVIAGFVWINPRVARDGKYAVSKDMYMPDLYPSFCSGAGYILSRGSMAAILEGSTHISILPRDDPYYTGILAQAMGINLLTFPNTSFLLLDYQNPVQQLKTQPVMVIHGLDTRQWYLAWNDLRFRYRKGLNMNTTIRSLAPRENVRRLNKLSKSLYTSIPHECHNDIIFNDSILT